MATAARRSATNGKKQQQSSGQRSKPRANGSGSRQAGEHAARAAGAGSGSSRAQSSSSSSSKSAGSSGRNGSSGSGSRGRAAGTRGRSSSGSKGSGASGSSATRGRSQSRQSTRGRSSSGSGAGSSGSTGSGANGSSAQRGSNGSGSASDIAKHVGLSVATGTLGAAAGIAGGILLGRTAASKKSRSVLGVKLPGGHVDFSGLSGLAKSVNDAGRQFGKLAGEVREARQKAEEIGKALR